MFFNLMRQSLILILKSYEFVVFKSLSVCLFQRRDPRDDIVNFVTLKKYLVL